MNRYYYHFIIRKYNKQHILYLIHKKEINNQLVQWEDKECVKRKCYLSNGKELYKV